MLQEHDTSGEGSPGWSSNSHWIMLRPLWIVFEGLELFEQLLGNFSVILSKILFSRLFHISKITFPKILKVRERNIWTISNSLESVLRLEKSSNSQAGLYGPFGKSSETFEKSPLIYSAEDSMFSRLCQLRWSVAPMFRKLTQNNVTTIRNINWRVESVNGTFKQSLWNSVKKLCAFQFVSYQLNYVS